MMPFLRHPVVHFALLGSVLWLGVQLWQDWRFRVVSMPSATEIDQLESRWRQRNNQPLDEELRQALLRHELDQRLLFREALRRKLHLRDPVVLMRLRQDAEFLGMQGDGADLIRSAIDLQLYQGDDVIRRRLLERMRSMMTAEVELPDESQLRQLMANSQQATGQTRYSFRHLFYRHNPKNPQQAQRRAQQALASGSPGDQASDPFLHGENFDGLSLTDIKERFGQAFAANLNALQTQQWQGPMASRYGWHLVFPTAITQDTAQAHFERQKPGLTALWQEQQQHQKLADYLNKLRQRYRVVQP